MILKLTDSLEIALLLLGFCPEQDPLKIHFTDLRDWVLALENYDDQLEHCNECILEAIQLAWIDQHD